MKIQIMWYKNSVNWGKISLYSGPILYKFNEN